MFGFFTSVEKQMRSTARNWLELADKVYHYRRDELKDADRAALQQKMENLRAALKDRADASKLKLGIESLEGVLRNVGGRLYPKSTLQEYVEFFLVAALVVLGIRTYFIQPFKIPTNSMWPTYNGMTAEVFRNPEEAPSGVARAVRLAAFLASRREAVAPASGDVVAEVADNGALDPVQVQGRKWVVIPEVQKQYEFFVGNEPVAIRVPGDFNDFDSALRESLGLSAADWMRKVAASPRHPDRPGFRLVTLKSGVKRGETFLSFDILGGDQLFVDRFSYHFFPPQVGQSFVFRTKRIQGLPDQYYIKRLAGAPGDKLEIREPVLYRNGRPITGAQAFEDNGARRPPYDGYFNVGLLSKGRVMELPPGAYVALGDNSDSSLDSRYWGYVPEKEIVGRPLWIYYPFTKHWGPAK